jgi:hypothetical protein
MATTLTELQRSRADATRKQFWAFFEKRDVGRVHFVKMGRGSTSIHVGDWKHPLPLWPPPTLKRDVSLFRRSGRVERKRARLDACARKIVLSAGAVLLRIAIMFWHRMQSKKRVPCEKHEFSVVARTEASDQ